MTRLRLATLNDVPAIANMYNQGIEDRVATFETRLRTSEEVEQWFDGVHPIVFLEATSNRSSLSRPPASTVLARAMRARPSFSASVERA